VLVTVPKIKEDDDKSTDVDKVDGELLRPQPERQATNGMNVAVKIHASRPILDLRI
jgi:hypothetical protein